MKAIWNNHTLAEASPADLIRIEGTWYFPPSALDRKHFKDSELHTECFWKGTANYYDVVVGNDINDGAAWYYPAPKDGSIERVGKDYTNYVAFWRGVTVSS